MNYPIWLGVSFRIPTPGPGVPSVTQKSATIQRGNYWPGSCPLPPPSPPSCAPFSSTGWGKRFSFPPFKSHWKASRDSGGEKGKICGCFPLAVFPWGTFVGCPGSFVWSPHCQNKNEYTFGKIIVNKVGEEKFFFRSLSRSQLLRVFISAAKNVCYSWRLLELSEPLFKLDE